uniref:MAGE domain-containing protein n=1 Tax=Acrobeloides nanus TaxID=290746 RepID=A0A914EIR4_9BILA
MIRSQRRGRAAIESDDEDETNRMITSTQRKKNVRNRVNSDSDDDPDAPGPSTRIPKFRRPLAPVQQNRSFDEEMEVEANGIKNESQQNEGDITKTLAQYLLSTCSRRRFAKEDELRRIMGHRVKAEVRETYMETVEKLLKDTLGIKIIHDPKSKKYWINSELEVGPDVYNPSDSDQDSSDEDLKDLKQTDNEDAQKGLVMTILTYIFMLKQPVSTDPGISEEDLQDFLKELEESDPSVSRERLTAHGDLTKELEAKGWIKLNKVSDHQGYDAVFFDWGPRALKSVDPLKCLEYFFEIYGGGPQDWQNKVDIANRQRAENGFKELGRRSRAPTPQ